MTDQKDNKSVSTKGGDKGKTSLFDGTRISKASLRPETYGTLDETSAFIGLARSKTRDAFLKESLLKIQNLIFRANGELACPSDAKGQLSKRFTPEDLVWIETRAKEVEAKLNLPPRFVLYGETEVGALLDIARAVVRRAERIFCALAEVEPIEPTELKPFINRLSDLLYLLARRDEREAGVPFQHPEE